jgi:hypothetical protein
MADWTEPQNLREWAGRAFRLRPVVVGGILLALLAAELKFDWLERAAGDYLVSTNAGRPESGAIWEKGRKTQIARTAIEKLAADREAYQRMARNAGSFSEVVDALAPGQGVMLSVEHFREIYRKLPEGFAAELLSPFDLLRLQSEGRWSRAYLERSADGLVVYLLEPNNHVLRQVKVGAASLSALARGSAAAGRTLDDLPDFRSRIYPAERFFAALASLPEEVQRGLISQPERLLDVSGQITRVGISDESVSGRVDVGFEIRTGAQRRVELVQAQDWAVWRLRSALEGRRTGGGAASSYTLQ